MTPKKYVRSLRPHRLSALCLDAILLRSCQSNPMPERLRASDFRFIAICLAMLAGTVWFSVRNYHYAFPEASIDFRVNRQGALSLAGKFLSDRGYRVADYREASRFSFDDPVSYTHLRAHETD